MTTRVDPPAGAARRALLAEQCAPIPATRQATRDEMLEQLIDKLARLIEDDHRAGRARGRAARAGRS